MVYGVGNPGRQDDGLGPALIAILEKKKANLTLEAAYQLQVEDSLLFSEQDMVIIVDALKTGNKPFIFKKIKPKRDFTFTSHSLSAEAVAFLCQKLYERTPEVYILGIRGYEFNPGEKLSQKARSNLREALAYLMELLRKPGLPKNSFDIIERASGRKAQTGRKNHGKDKKRSPGA